MKRRTINGRLIRYPCPSICEGEHDEEEQQPRRNGQGQRHDWPANDFSPSEHGNCQHRIPKQMPVTQQEHAFKHAAPRRGKVKM